MPVFKNRTAFEIARGVRAFLNLEAGITRNGEGASAGAGGPPVAVAAPPAPRAAGKPRQQPAEGPARRAVAPAGDPPMFFLVGRAKSGTSWLMRLLDSHPEIVCKGEGKFFGKDSPRSLFGAYAAAEDLQRWIGNNPWTSQYKRMPQEEFIGLIVKTLMRERLAKTDKRIVGDKTPFLSDTIVEEIGTMVPGARVVHIVRDGRDVAVSSVHHRWNNATDRGGHFALTDEQRAKREAYRQDPSSFGPGKESIFGGNWTSAAAREWSAKVNRVMADGAALPEGNFYQVRYEDLLADPIPTTRALLGFLGADAGEATARGCVEAASFERLSGGRAQGEEDSSSFYRKGVAGDWRSVFTEEDRQAFKEGAGELLVRLGYEKDGDW